MGSRSPSINRFVATVAGSAQIMVMLDVERGAKSAYYQAVPRWWRDGEQVGQLGVQLLVDGKFPEELMRTVDYRPAGAIAARIRRDL